jgi:hypothetical protein
MAPHQGVRRFVTCSCDRRSIWQQGLQCSPPGNGARASAYPGAFSARMSELHSWQRTATKVRSANNENLNDMDWDSAFSRVVVER